MAKLNERTDETKKIIHIMITDKCNRKCPDCCNNQYDINLIERVTAEELREAEIIFLTGGEPFAYYPDPCSLAHKIKQTYPNIKQVMIYTNAYELVTYLKMGGVLHDLDGLTISIKSKKDMEAIKYLIEHDSLKNIASIRTYVFDGFQTYIPANWDPRRRVWQKDFKPATDSIFRRL